MGLQVRETVPFLVKSHANPSQFTHGLRYFFPPQINKDRSSLLVMRVLSASFEESRQPNAFPVDIFQLPEH